MKPKTYFSTAILVGALAPLAWGTGTSPARAVPLASLPVGIFSSDPVAFGGNIVENSIQYSFWVDTASNPFPDIGHGALLLQFTLTEADAGHTLVASALNMSSSFTTAAARLTNFTLNDYLSEMTEFPGGGGGGSGAPENGYLDLRGKTVGSVKLIVDTLTIDTPGEDLNHDGIWTDVNFNGTLVFDSEAPPAPPAATPEPGTIALFGAALGALGLARRRRRA